MKPLMIVCLMALSLSIFQESASGQRPKPQSDPSNPVSSPETYRPGFRTDPIEIPRILPPEPLRPLVTPEARIVRKGVLAPSANDVAQHKFLLSQKKTGLIRLLPREAFDSAMYRVKAKVSMRGGGAYYSFYYRSHEYGYGSDISFEGGSLHVGFAGADYGMLTDLGDTELELIDANDPRAGFLVNYQPPIKEAEARIEARKFFSSLSIDGVHYERQLPAEVNHTYLLRSIVYDKSDLLVAFRIVSKANDGGLTIAWKILKKFSTPQLVRT